MGYNRKTWTNRESEYPNRYQMTSTNGNIANVAIIPNEGTVTSEGDKFDADTMNDMEGRINNGFTSVGNDLSSLNTTLRGLITTEATRATGEENLIWHDVHENASNLASEITRAQSAEETLTTNLSEEVARAQGVESGLSTDVNSLGTRVTNAESDVATLSSRITGLETNIGLETDRAEQVEAGLQTNINSVSSNLQAEITRAEGVEQQLSTDLANEALRAQEAEAELRSSITRTYKASGSVYFADLPALDVSRQGNVYDVKDAFTTTSDFQEGAGKDYPAGTNVAIVSVEGEFYTEVTPTGTENPSQEGWYVLDDDEYVLTTDTEVESGTTYYSYSDYKMMYDANSGFIDTSHFVTDTDYATSQAAGIVKPDGTTCTVDEYGVLSSIGGGHGSAEAAEMMIAPIEADATASARAYSVGQRLILNEILYKAKTAIAIGDALVVDTNIEADSNITTQLSTKYDTSDTESETINDTDYVPMSESGGTKKKTLWSTIVSKIKTALGIESSGGTYLKKDGTWDTPANTTYTFATGDSNGQIKVTPSGGNAQNVDVKGLGSAAYTASTAYAAASHTHNYAGSSSAGGAATSLSGFENNNNTGKNANDVTYNAHTYYTTNGPATSLGASTNDGALYTQAYSTSWIAQIAQDYRNGNLFTRGKNNGTWSAWRKVRYTDDTVSYATSAGSASKVGSSTVGSASRPIYLNGGTPTQISYTIEKSVPSNAVFTDTNTWRGIQNNLTSTSTTDSLSANQGRLLANGSARDSTKLPLSGGTVTGTITLGLGGGSIYNSGAASSGTTHVTGSEFLNLRSPGIQCRTYTDGGWAGISASTFTSQSSRRYKENIEDISEKEANKLLDIRVVKFDFKENVTDEEHRYNQHGVIAEETAEIIPQVVTYAIPYGQEDEFDEPVPDSVDYAKFVPYLIKMIQMQQKEIDELKTLVKERKDV